MFSHGPSMRRDDGIADLVDPAWVAAQRAREQRLDRIVREALEMFGLHRMTPRQLALVLMNPTLEAFVVGEVRYRWRLPDAPPRA